MRTEIKYHIAADLLGGRANAFSEKSFTTYEEAVRYWEVEYRDRNKNDGYDEYWRKIPLRIQQVITNDLWKE